MNTAFTTIIAAGVAVLGTLLSPILAQYSASRNKAQEYELARRQRQEERDAERKLQEFIEVRSMYTSLNTEMRAYHRALRGYLFLMRSGHCDKDARQDLNNSRHAYLQCYADAQMIVSDNVFNAAVVANDGLSRLYGIALRLDGFTEPGLSSGAATADKERETIESALSYSENVRQHIWEMRGIMRKELGVGSYQSSPAPLDELRAHPSGTAAAAAARLSRPSRRTRAARGPIAVLAGDLARHPVIRCAGAL